MSQEPTCATCKHFTQTTNPPTQNPEQGYCRLWRSGKRAWLWCWNHDPREETP